jgi:hypothetical protein
MALVWRMCTRLHSPCRAACSRAVSTANQQSSKMCTSRCGLFSAMRSPMSPWPTTTMPPCVRPRLRTASVRGAFPVRHGRCRRCGRRPGAGAVRGVAFIVLIPRLSKSCVVKRNSTPRLFEEQRPCAKATTHSSELGCGRFMVPPRCGLSAALSDRAGSALSRRAAPRGPSRRRGATASRPCCPGRRREGSTARACPARSGRPPRAGRTH